MTYAQGCTAQLQVGGTDKLPSASAWDDDTHTLRLAIATLRQGTPPPRVGSPFCTSSSASHAHPPSLTRAVLGLAPRSLPTRHPPAPRAPRAAPTATGLSVPANWRCSLNVVNQQLVIVDLYQFYQCVVSRGIAPSAPDPEWAALLQACAVTGRAAASGGAAALAAAAIRQAYHSRIRGFIDFVADLVRQYEIAKREGTKRQHAATDTAVGADRQRPVRPPVAAAAAGGRGGSGGYGGAAAQRSPAPEPPDPFPSDRLRSAVVWLRRAALECATAPHAEATAHNAALARRYKQTLQRAAAATRAALPQELYPLFGAQAPAALRRSGRTRQQTEQQRRSSE
jgi:hypothetical protein